MLLSAPPLSMILEAPPLSPASPLALRQALETLAANPAQTARMGQAARSRVTDLFTWPRRAEQIAQIYDWVLGRRPTRPEPIKHS